MAKEKVSDAWVGSWASSQQIPEPNNALASEDVSDITLRQIVRLTLGGKRLRIVLSNEFGTEPLRLDAVQVALAVSPASSRIDPATDHAVKFLGASDVIIPPGTKYLSDPIDMKVNALSSLAVSFHVAAAIAQQTSHPGSRATSYLAHGNHVSALELSDAKKIDHWYQLTGVSVETTSDAKVIVTLGDSITDGRGSTTNGNDRWPDVLADRLQASKATRNIAVLNVGKGGNRLLMDGAGPSALSRFERDVLAQPGVRYVIILEGVNDLGVLTRDAPVSADAHNAMVKQVIGAYQQMIWRAHAQGIKVIGATIYPYMGFSTYHPDAMNEADRQAVNAWIRTPGNFDAMVDLDQVMRDPDHPDHLLAAYDSGDHLHSSPAGLRAMANAIPLSLFVH